MKKGWIKLHRKLRDNPYMRRPAYRAVWLELLFEAEHGMKLVEGQWVKKEESEMKSIIWKGKRIYLKPGQLTCGAKQLSKWAGVPRGTVERILKCFKSEEQIEEQTSSQFSLITINNWGAYQQSEEQNEEPVRNQRGTSEEPVRTPKECKNEKNVKNVKKYIYTFKKFLENYNKTFGKDYRPTKGRQRAFLNRLRTFTYEEMTKAMENMSKNKFLCGENNSNNFIATIDFFLKKEETIDILLNQDKKCPNKVVEQMGLIKV